MKAATRYSNAPIAEAIIDLRVKLPEGVAISDVLRSHSGQEDAYPQKKDLNRFVGQFEISQQAPSTSATADHIGFSFASSDEKQVYVARLDGFTASRLAPYDRWEHFRNEARRLWDVYRSAVRPTCIERIAVRYVNRLNLPGERVELKDYLRTSPEVSPDLPQGLEGFFLQVRIPHPDIKCTSLLNETGVPPPHLGVVSVVLDIDLFRTEDVPQDEGGLWNLFEALHERKNDIFEACITNRTRELIQ